MRLSAEQLGTAIAKRFFPVYLVCGDEPLQYTEALDSIRAICKGAGYAEREVFDVEAGFSWERFDVAARTLGLFSQKRLLELRFGSGLPDKKTETHLANYLNRLPADVVLLLSCGKLAKTSAKAPWFEALDRAGLIVQVWPVQRNKFLSWLESRAKVRGLVLDARALRVLAGRVEGNLLAAAQEIEKLYVLYGSSPLDADAVREVVGDSAHYDVFDLADAALAGQTGRCYRILGSVRAEGIAPQIVLWAFARELRMLAKMRFELARGASRANLFRDHRIWENRKPLVDAALSRLGLHEVQDLLGRCAEIDLIGKGLADGDVWEHLWLLSLAIAGEPDSMTATIRAGVA
ncbi:MAG: DNA polymerase III subunit delta [Gammaproteobacteria bacterium]